MGVPSPLICFRVSHRHAPGAFQAGLTWSSSSATETVGLGPVGAVNSNNDETPFGALNIQDPTFFSGQPLELQGNQFITTAANGQLDAVYTDSGYGPGTNPGATQGVLYASNLLNFTPNGASIVDGNAVNFILNPVAIA